MQLSVDNCNCLTLIQKIRVLTRMAHDVARWVGHTINKCQRNKIRNLFCMAQWEKHIIWIYGVHGWGTSVVGSLWLWCSNLCALVDTLVGVAVIVVIVIACVTEPVIHCCCWLSWCCRVCGVVTYCMYTAGIYMGFMLQFVLLVAVMWYRWSLCCSGCWQYYNCVYCCHNHCRLF